MSRFRNNFQIFVFFVVSSFGWICQVNSAEGATLPNCGGLQQSQSKLANVIAESNLLLVGENHAHRTDLERGSALLPLLACSGRKVTIVFEWPVDDQHSFDSYLDGIIDQKKLWEQIKIAEYWFTVGWEKDGQYMQLLDWSKRFHFAFAGGGTQLDDNDPSVELCSKQIKDLRQSNYYLYPDSLFQFGCTGTRNIFRDADFAKEIIDAKNNVKDGLVVFYGGVNHPPIIAAIASTLSQDVKMNILDLSKWDSSTEDSNLDEFEYRFSSIYGFQVIQYLKKSSGSASRIGNVSPADVDLAKLWTSKYFTGHN